MTIIHNEKSVVLKMIAPKDTPRGPLKWSAYTLLLDADDGCLIWNTLTSMLIRLDGIGAAQAQAHPEALPEAQALYTAAFLVPADMDEDARLHDLEFVLRTVRKPKDSNSYTILTTTACNARCPYCFERDYVRNTMSEETARDTAKFIKRTVGKQMANLIWFGGEPLVNSKAIDTICQALCENGTEYQSTMTTNGYLFDEALIQKAVKGWKLQSVQITLDGTEETYNRVKGYVNATGSPYRRVLDNIDALIAAGIHVRIRLNMSTENAMELLMLAGELASRYAGQKNVSVYGILLYEYGEETPKAVQRELLTAYKKLADTLWEYGLYHGKGLPTVLHLNSCKADNDGCYTILPTGKISKCEHYCDSGFVGDIWQGVTDKEMVVAYKERETHGERCKTCLFAPTCTLLKMCVASCHDLSLATQRITLEYSIRAAYRNWKEKGE